MGMGQLLRTFAISLRNFLLGGNLVSLSLLSPRKIAFYATETLFYFDTLHSRRGIPERNVFEVLQVDRDVQQISLALPSSPNRGTWFNACSSRAPDIVSLCLICRILKPRVVF